MDINTSIAVPRTTLGGTAIDTEASKEQDSPVTTELDVINGTADGASIPDAPPDGGLQAWTQVIAGHLIMFATWGYINSFGFFQTHYVTAFNRTPSEVSWIISTQIFLLSLISTFSGRVTDAGYYRITMITGFSLQIFGIFMASMARNYWQAFLAQGVCSGIAGGLLWCPTVSLVSTWFLRKRSIALCLIFCGNSLGGLVLPLIAQQTLPRIGFHWTVRIIGFIMLAFFAVSLALVRTRVPPRTTGPFLESAAFREPTYVLYVAGGFLVTWAVSIPTFYANSYATSVLGVPASTSLTLIYLLNGLSIPGRITPAIIADRFLGPLNTFVTFSLIAGIIFYSWAAVHTLRGDLAFSAIYGFFSAGAQGLFGAALTSLTTDLQKMGVRTGMAMSIVSIACLTGPPLAGALIQHGHGSYFHVQVWGGTAIVCGAVCIVGARVASTGWYLRKKV